MDSHFKSTCDLPTQNQGGPPRVPEDAGLTRQTCFHKDASLMRNETVPSFNSRSSPFQTKTKTEVRAGPQGHLVACRAPSLIPTIPIRCGAKWCQISFHDRGRSLYTNFLYTPKLPIAPLMGQLLVNNKKSSKMTNL